MCVDFHCRLRLRPPDVPHWDWPEVTKIIAVAKLRAFWERHPDAEQPLKAWYDEVRHATWRGPGDVEQYDRSASILESRRVVFNVKGSDYRLIIAVACEFDAVYIKFIGTQRQYEQIDANTVSQE